MVVVSACVYMAAPAEAQLNTQHLKGTVGLKSGSQAPPGVYFIAPLFYVYKADEVKDRDGNRLALPVAADLTSHVYGGGISVVTSRKLFGGLYGFQVLFPVGANNRMQGTENRCQSRRGSVRFGDSADQPRVALHARGCNGRIHNTLYGFVKVNYQWEVYARTTTQGSELTFLATFLMKPLKLPNP